MNVELTYEHLRRMRRSATTGLLELIRNGLDAGATNVGVAFARNGLGGISSVTVTDDGVGMSVDHVRHFFTPLSVSWKREAAAQRGMSAPGRPPVTRPLIGRKGEGRLTAFGIGSTVTWTSAWDEDGELHCHRIVWTDAEFDSFGVQQLGVGSTDALAVPGTRVTVSDVRASIEQLTAAKTRRLLESKLGLYLERYPDVTVELDGQLLSARNVQSQRVSIPVAVPDETRSSPRFSGASDTAMLEVIEWAIPTSPAIWLASPGASASYEIPFRESHPGVSFTAWLRWDGWPLMGADAAIATLSPDAEPLIDASRQALSAHLRARSAERVAELLEEWKEEGSYPYQGEPANAPARAERELFDIVAVTAAPALEQSDTIGRTFSLRLLAEAVRTDQTNLGRILREVLALDDETQEQLTRLLDRAPLSAIVELSHIVFQRATFLEWLKNLLFEGNWAAAVGETPGLHDLLAPNTWLFGDEWTLVASEIGLTNTARAHEAMLATDLHDPTAYENDEERLAATAEDEEVLDATGARRRLDLLLVQGRGRRDEPHYLVVELKRPSRRLTKGDLSQIENYLDTLGAHPRFANPKIKWTFLLVGKDCVDAVDRKRKQAAWPIGLTSDGEFACGSKYQLWVRTWSEVLSEADQRLDFLRSALNAAPSTSEEFVELHRIHADVLPTLNTA